MALVRDTTEQEQLAAEVLAYRATHAVLHGDTVLSAATAAAIDRVRDEIKNSIRDASGPIAHDYFTKLAREVIDDAHARGAIDFGTGYGSTNIPTRCEVNRIVAGLIGKLAAQMTTREMLWAIRRALGNAGRYTMTGLYSEVERFAGTWPTESSPAHARALKALHDEIGAAMVREAEAADGVANVG